MAQRKNYEARMTLALWFMVMINKPPQPTKINFVWLEVMNVFYMKGISVMGSKTRSMIILPNSAVLLLC
jgi:hypothetical protein